MSRRPDRFVRRVRTVVLSVALVGALTGCADAAPTPTPSVPEPPPSPTASATATPTPTEEPGPTLLPGGTAADNLPFFASIVEEVWAGPDKVKGRAYIDALAAAGFDRSRMQVTEDESTVGNPAESIQFSVQWDEAECLVGQVGPATGDPVAVVLPAIAEGGCLIGRTRPIDW